MSDRQLRHGKMGWGPSTFTLVTDTPMSAEALFDLSLGIDAHVASVAQSSERAVAGGTKGRIDLGETVAWRARHDRPTNFTDRQVRGPFRTFVHEHRFEQLATGSRMTDTITLISPVFG